ncbi:hypothetical protein N9D75_02290, partial [Pseudomonadales bacterium]|nr:hypothetical protein [Pseudomonadales bacterium]
PSEENLDQASKRLGIINASYTMYRDLVIADSGGSIVATSKAENKDRLQRINVSEHSWFRQGKQISDSVDFAVQDVCDSELENEKTSPIIAYSNLWLLLPRLPRMTSPLFTPIRI